MGNKFPRIVFPQAGRGHSASLLQYYFCEASALLPDAAQTSTLLAQSSYFSAALGQHQQYINSHYIAGGQNGNN